MTDEQLGYDPATVRDRIKQAGLTQQDVAARIGISPSFLSESLSGTRRLSQRDLRKLARVVGAKVNELRVAS